MLDGGSRVGFIESGTVKIWKIENRKIGEVGRDTVESRSQVESFLALATHHEHDVMIFESNNHKLRRGTNAVRIGKGLIAFDYDSL